MTQDEAARIRVLLADDQAMVRGALKALLSLEPDLEVVADVSAGNQVLPAVREHRVDVAVLDIEMPGATGIEVVEQLRETAPQCRCLILTTFGRPGYLRRALESGARGFLVKDTPSEDLADAIRALHAGERVMDPLLAQESLASGRSPLTEREADVLREALSGASIKEIAGALHLSQGTVRNHLSSAIGKTHTASRGAAAFVARDQGWL